MNVLYYVVVYRPKGSKTWTPYSIEGSSTGNFFATACGAKGCATYLSTLGLKTVLLGTQHTVPMEFGVGEVSLVE